MVHTEIIGDWVYNNGAEIYYIHVALNIHKYIKNTIVFTHSISTVLLVLFS